MDRYPRICPLCNYRWVTLSRGLLGLYPRIPRGGRSHTRPRSPRPADVPWPNLGPPSEQVPWPTRLAGPPGIWF